MKLELTPSQRRELEAVVAHPRSHFGHVRRARVVLLSADGISSRDIANRLRLSIGQVSRIRRRFERWGVPGLAERRRAGRKDHAVPSSMIETIMSMAASAPPSGHRRWSTRLIGARIGLCSATVAKVLRARRTSSGPVSDGAEEPSEVDAVHAAQTCV